MNYSNSWHDYLARVQAYMQQQDNRMKELEQRLARIENNENNHSNAKNTTIEKLEYHFDQLKIERLDGTLHIGISPEDLSNVDDLSLNQSPINNYQRQVKPVTQQLVEQLDSYLINEGPALLNQLSNEHGLPLNQSYQELIVNDVRKQLPERVAHYEKNARSDAPTQTDQELKELIYEQVQKEINHSLRQFFQNDQPKGDK
ncbi:spore germination protein GerPC [Aquibacillus saliphilus]|uniref:spore germination protein GerPC n=1 Tax=Aquibacillus saliphilus TaxID=1909422 RepID=UPI001CEFDE04|nr:spore germination protein GerPC [Aquibacillus saliphilus]